MDLKSDSTGVEVSGLFASTGYQFGTSYFLNAVFVFVFNFVASKRLNLSFLMIFFFKGLCARSKEGNSSEVLTNVFVTDEMAV